MTTALHGNSEGGTTPVQRTRPATAPVEQSSDGGNIVMCDITDEALVCSDGNVYQSIKKLGQANPDVVLAEDATVAGQRCVATPQATYCLDAHRVE
jgi:hypothetical protein